MQEIIIYGASGHGSVILDIIEKINEQSGQYTIGGIVDDMKPEGEFYGYPVVGGMEKLFEAVRERNACVAVAVGEITIREMLVEKIRAEIPACVFPALVHPAAVLARDVQVGSGSVVCANAVLNTAAQVKEFCIINTAAVVEHDCSVGDYSMINPRAVLGGNTHVADRAMVGLGASVIHNICVGKGAIVASGAVCVADVAEYSVVMGVPAKQVRTRTASERYL